ncbi:hypothetical protein K0U83_04175 [bacterium]|nr:hypothetical protein [bacterium]
MDVIIPSFRRAEQCAQKTLTTLARQAAGARAQVWLSDWEEREDYERAAREAGVYDAISVVFRQGEPGLGRNRRAAYHGQEKEGWILSMDDDIEKVIYRVDEKRVEEADISRFWEEGIALSDMMGVHLFGLYPVANPYFMRANVRSGLTFIIGGCYAEKVRPGDDAILPIADNGLRDDFERSLLHWERYGGVLRFEEYSFVEKIFRNPGGLQAGDRNEADDRRERQRIVDTWPDVTKLWQRKNGRWEIKLIDPSPKKRRSL